MMIRPIHFISLSLALLTHTAAAQDSTPNCQPPQLLGMLSGLNDPATLTIDGNYAYIAQHDDSFLIIDISDTANPTLLAHADDLPIQVDDNTRIIINQNAAYVGGSIISIDDKTDPWFVRYGAITERPLINGYFYPRSKAYFDRTDIYNSTRPYAIGIDTFEEPHSLGFEFGGLPVAYVDGLLVTDRLDRFNIDNPHAPFLVDDSNDPNIYTIDEYRYDEPYLLFFEDSTNVDPQINIYQQVTDAFLSIDIGGIAFHDLAVKNETLFTLSEGLSIYTLTEDPTRIASHYDDPILADARFIRPLGEHFVIVSDDTLAIYDIPTNPIASIRTNLSQEHLELMGDTAILSTGNIDTGPTQGASIIDISNPELPVWIADLPTPNAFGIDTLDPYVFVADKNEGLKVFDLSAPASPQLVATYNTSTNQAGNPNTRDIVIDGSYAYAADRNAGLTIYGIVNTHELQPIATLPLTQALQRVSVSGDLAFASGLNKLFIIDISDPTTPTIVSTIDEILGTRNYIYSVTKRGNWIYTAESDSGYRIFDITNPADPIELAHFDASVSTKQGTYDGFVFDLHFDGDLLYVAMSWIGYAVYDNSDPFNPVLLRHTLAADPPENAIARYRDIEIRDDKLFISAGPAGLRIYDLNNCDLPCYADLNEDTVLNFFDVSAFIIAFTSEDFLADFNNDGELNFFDVSEFIVAFNNGCP